MWPELLNSNSVLLPIRSSDHRAARFASCGNSSPALGHHIAMRRDMWTCAIFTMCNSIFLQLLAPDVCFPRPPSMLKGCFAVVAFPFRVGYLPKFRVVSAVELYFGAEYVQARLSAYLSHVLQVASARFHCVARPNPWGDTPAQRHFSNPNSRPATRFGALRNGRCGKEPQLVRLIIPIPETSPRQD